MTWAAHTLPRKEDVIRNLLESMKQPVDMKKESKGPVPTKKPRDLPPLELGFPDPPRHLPPLELGALITGKLPTLEIKGTVKRSGTG